MPLGGQPLPWIAVAPPEVGGEHFYGHQGLPLADGGHGVAKQAGAVVGLVVAGYGGEHHIAQPEPLHGLGHPLGFAGIQGEGCLALGYLAKAATAGADRAPQQEAGGAGGMALAPVRATALLADGVQPLLCHHRLHRLQLAGFADRPLQPLG